MADRKKIINQQYVQYKDTSFNKEKIDFIIPSPGIPTLGKNQHKIITYGSFNIHIFINWYSNGSFLFCFL